MNDRVNFSKRGQMIMKPPISNPGIGPNFGRNYDSRLPSDIELKLAQDSLYLLKSKMSKTLQQIEKSFSLNQRKPSTSTNNDRGTGNPNYRRVQTFTEGNPSNHRDF